MSGLRITHVPEVTQGLELNGRERVKLAISLGAYAMVFEAEVLSTCWYNERVEGGLGVAGR